MTTANPIVPARIFALRDLIKDNWSLCEFMGKSEAEYMVAETIHAAAINLEAKGEAFSYRGDGVLSRSPHCDNRGSYGKLVADGYFEEDERDGRPVIFPTEKLIAKLEAFFAAKSAKKTEGGK